MKGASANFFAEPAVSAAAGTMGRRADLALAADACLELESAIEQLQIELTELALGVTVEVVRRFLILAAKMLEQLRRRNCADRPLALKAV